jgi:hypothetical protein
MQKILQLLLISAFLNSSTVFAGAFFKPLFMGGEKLLAGEASLITKEASAIKQAGNVAKETEGSGLSKLQNFLGLGDDTERTLLSKYGKEGVKKLKKDLRGCVFGKLKRDVKLAQENAEKMCERSFLECKNVNEKKPSYTDALCVREVNAGKTYQKQAKK